MSTADMQLMIWVLSITTVMLSTWNWCLLQAVWKLERKIDDVKYDTYPQEYINQKFTTIRDVMAVHAKDADKDQEKVLAVITLLNNFADQIKFPANGLTTILPPGNLS